MLLPTNVITSTWIIASLQIDPVKGIKKTEIIMSLDKGI